MDDPIARKLEALLGSGAFNRQLRLDETRGMKNTFQPTYSGGRNFYYSD